MNPTFKTPANAAIAVGFLAAHADRRHRPLGARSLAIAATGMIYLSYFLCNLGVLWPGATGWPHKGAWFNLGRWGTVINILALIWGGVMIVNIGLWQTRRSSATSAATCGTLSNPFIDTSSLSVGQQHDGLPPWPIFETIVGVDRRRRRRLLRRLQRGRLDAGPVEADAATGEAMIG